jgi:hypothetical protein
MLFVAQEYTVAPEPRTRRWGGGPLQRRTAGRPP